jgi:uncharacterized damage-inducible protein DinB
MTYYGPRELSESMRVVRRNTITIAEDIPEKSYDFRPTAHSRSVREVLLHVVSRTLFDFHVHGEERLDSLEHFDFRSFFASLPIHDKLPLSKEAILVLLREEGDRWARFVEKLPESVLEEKVRMRPDPKSRFEMLLGTKEHEMHHRAQLMVIERLLGIVPHLTRNRQAVPEVQKTEGTTSSENA